MGGDKDEDKEGDKGHVAREGDVITVGLIRMSSRYLHVFFLRQQYRRQMTPIHTSCIQTDCIVVFLHTTSSVMAEVCCHWTSPGISPRILIETSKGVYGCGHITMG